MDDYKVELQKTHDHRADPSNAKSSDKSQLVGSQRADGVLDSILAEITSG